MTVLPLLALSLSLAAAPAAGARPGPTEEWCGKRPPAPVEVDADACAAGATRFRVVLRSPSGCAAEEDMTLALQQGKRSAEARWPGPDATRWWVLDPGPDWKRAPRSACARIDTLPAGKDRLLLLLRTSARPNADRLVAVLYDVRRNAVVELQDVAPAGALVAWGEGEVWFREGERTRPAADLVRTPQDELPLPDGDRLIRVAGDQAPLNPVWRVGVKGDHVVARRDVARTYEPFKKFFPDAPAFEKAFGWAGQEVRTFVRRGSTAVGRECVQPHRGEGGDAWRTLPWYCEPKAK